VDKLITFCAALVSAVRHKRLFVYCYSLYSNSNVLWNLEN